VQVSRYWIPNKECRSTELKALKVTAKVRFLYNMLPTR